jgi:hypothetical protein
MVWLAHMLWSSRTTLARIADMSITATLARARCMGIVKVTGLHLSCVRPPLAKLSSTFVMARTVGLCATLCMARAEGFGHHCYDGSLEGSGHRRTIWLALSRWVLSRSLARPMTLGVIAEVWLARSVWASRPGMARTQSVGDITGLAHTRTMVSTKTMVRSQHMDVTANMAHTLPLVVTPRCGSHLCYVCYYDLGSHAAYGVL